MADTDRRSNAPQSVERVLRILETLSGADGPLSLAELARKLDTPKTSLSALVRGLEAGGYVSAAKGAWQLGPAAFGLGSALIAARRGQQSSEVMRDGLRRLAAATGETVLFAVADGDGETLTYVDIVESPNSVRFAVSIGLRRPLYCTAAGRVLLSARSDAQVEAYLRRAGKEALTASTLTDKAGLKTIVAQVRQDGVAQTVDQAADGVTGTAAPVRDENGQIVGALVVAAPSSRLTGALERIAGLTRAEAAAISRHLGDPGA